MDRVLIFGDSIPYGKWDLEGGWVSRLRKYIDVQYNIGKNGNIQVYNLGFPGETTERLVSRLPTEMRLRCWQGEEIVIILQVGVNDVNHANFLHKRQIPKEKFIINFQSLISEIKKYTNSFLIFGMMPVVEERLWVSFPGFKDHFFNHEVVEYSTVLEQLCVDEAWSYVGLKDAVSLDQLEDGIHPNSDGHKILFVKVKEWLVSKRLIS